MKALIILDTYLETGFLLNLLPEIQKNHEIIQIAYNPQITEIINLTIFKDLKYNYLPINDLKESVIENCELVLCFSSSHSKYTNIKDNYYKRLFQLAKSKSILFFSNNEAHKQKYDNFSNFILRNNFMDLKEIIEVLSCLSNNYKSKKIVITAGATLSNLDPVRYITNPAKGGTSYLLAKKFLKEGYSVHIIKGQNCIPEFAYLNNLLNYSEETVSTTEDLLNAVIKLKNKFDVYISPMAVSDIEFEYVDSKIKKNNMNNILHYKQAPDVLKYVIENKLPHQKIVGFAAETDLSDSVLQEKINRKPVDMLIANLVNSGFNKKDKQGFGTRNGYYKIVIQNKIIDLKTLTKEQLVELIFAKIN